MKLKPVLQPADPEPPCHDDWIIPEYLVEILADTAIGVELIDVFAADTIRQISELQKTVSQLDRRKAKDLLHGLAGSCAQIGAVTIAERCAQLETWIDSLGMSEILLRVGELGQCCEQLIALMNARFNSDSRSVGS